MRVTAQDVVAVSPTNIRANSSELWAVLDQGAGATGINSRGGITISPNDFNPERIQIDDRLFTNFSNPPVSLKPNRFFTVSLNSFQDTSLLPAGWAN